MDREIKDLNTDAQANILYTSYCSPAPGSVFFFFSFFFFKSHNEDTIRIL